MRLERSVPVDEIKLLIVDDQYLFLESLKVVIEGLAKDMKVVGIALDGEQALAAMEREPADVVLLDVRMPVMDGVATARQLRSRWPKTAVIMLTTFEDDEYVTEALRNGAHGYLLKNIAPQMLVSAVRAVLDGSVLIAPDIAGHLVESLYGGRQMTERVHGTTLPDWYWDLSPRERTIMKHMLRGRSNKEISTDIHLGEQTIRNYVSTIYSKLGATDRRDALRKAREIDSYYFE